MLERELCCVLHRFHDKAGADIIKVRFDELLIKRIVAGHVGDDCFQQVVDLPPKTVYFEHTGQLLYDYLKLPRPGRVVLIGFDGNKDR